MHAPADDDALLLIRAETSAVRPRSSSPDVELTEWEADPSDSALYRAELIELDSLVGATVTTRSRDAFARVLGGIVPDADGAQLRCLQWLRLTEGAIERHWPVLYDSGLLDPMRTPALIARGGGDGPVVVWRNDAHELAGVILFGERDFFGEVCTELPFTRCMTCAAAEHACAPAPPRWVYFVQAGAGGPIKVGTSGNVAGRIAALQTAHHAELRVLARARGGPAFERALHAALAAHRIRGEWFRPHADLFALIEELKR